MYPPRRTRNRRHEGDSVRGTIIVVVYYETIDPKLNRRLIYKLFIITR